MAHRAIAWALAVGLPLGPAAAEPRDVQPTQVAAQSPLPAELSDAGWRLLELPGKPPARFSGSERTGLQVSADGGVGFLYRPLADGEAGKARMSWHWRVDSAPPPSDLSVKGADDRPLAIHLWFPEENSFWGGLKSAAGALFDVPVPGKVLTYVWGGTQARGEKLVNPHLRDDGVLIVLRSGRQAPGGWVREQIDIAADFQMGFGYPPPAAAYIAISADSDDRPGRSLALVKDIRFDG
ncbi:MAG: DUF3047 domain-containing protein [Pseudomonadota bacterium]